MLAYWDMQLLDTTGRMLNESPYIHFNVAAKMLLFAPHPGMRLRALCVAAEFACVASVER